MFLLDINLLISLAWPHHVHHAAAHRWFATAGRGTWGTTPVTELGFVRVSCNPAFDAGVTPGEALSLLERLRALPGHVFLADDVQRVVGDHVPGRALVTHRQITDGHLLALALRHRARLATFDRGMAALAGDASQTVVLVPAG